MLILVDHEVQRRSVEEKFFTDLTLPLNFFLIPHVDLIDDFRWICNCVWTNAVSFQDLKRLEKLELINIYLISYIEERLESHRHRINKSHHLIFKNLTSTVFSKVIFLFKHFFLKLCFKKDKLLNFTKIFVVFFIPKLTKVILILEVLLLKILQVQHAGVFTWIWKWMSHCPQNLSSLNLIIIIKKWEKVHFIWF